MMTKIRDLMARREAGEKGFTLIELLVVIIIIGILAAVAIPIFLNQQKTAVDSNTRSDVRNVATNLQTALAEVPTANIFTIARVGTVDSEGALSNHPKQGFPGGPDFIRGNSTTQSIWVQVSNGNNHSSPLEVPVSEGTRIAVGTPVGHGNAPGPTGHFIIKAFNANGAEYFSESTKNAINNPSDANTLIYNSHGGGFQS